MKRAMALALLAVLTGCQSQNPYSMFGPNRVPTPGTQGQAPYYPATPGAAAGGVSRPSISADSSAPPVSSRSLAADSSDKEPIRIVENPAPAARTATSGATRNSGSSAAPSGGQQAEPTRDKSSRSGRASETVVPASFESAAVESASAAGAWKSR
jgi:hypothetical protein